MLGEILLLGFLPLLVYRKSKKIFYIFIFFLLFATYAYSNEIDFYKLKLPFKDSHLKAIYQLDNGNIIYIQRYERGNKIWERVKDSKELKEITFLWGFIALAKWCESIEERNIYFATNLEYWFGGGTKIDYSQIRIFNLYDPSPWRDSDLGIAPNMKYAEHLCEFYEPIFYSKW